ncbi:uncharacterized protein EAE97_007183 [Botrytis byssoidea]|uniref:Uncharacterized protein n=1 Tax=Botrytis byssoidea TaxID=139641 RepID=A0A9P5M3K2_9HELO|nr:uncharacterized protein EAE97_007183 [Botrytis byssoidea]KAF7939102.1 hypothetical protein EAE97_007183 [Botrytis byssoidea]
MAESSEAKIVKQGISAELSGTLNLSQVHKNLEHSIEKRRHCSAFAVRPFLGEQNVKGSLLPRIRRREERPITLGISLKK